MYPDAILFALVAWALIFLTSITNTRLLLNSYRKFSVNFNQPGASIPERYESETKNLSLKIKMIEGLKYVDENPKFGDEQDLRLN